MNKNYVLIVWAILLLLPITTHSQAAKIEGELKQWHKVNLSFQGPQTSEQDSINPFTDYRLTVTFSKDSVQYQIPGYYAADGHAGETSADTGNIWRVHFVPQDTGIWLYDVSFRMGTNIAISHDTLAGTSIAFDSLSGTLDIVASDKTGDDFRAKGILRYVDDHYLQFAGNREYFIKSGANSPENLLGYFEFDNTEDFGGVETPGLIDGLHRFAPHVADWQVGDPVWQGTKGKGIIGALNYLASQGVNSIYFLTYNTDGGDGQDTYMWVSPHDKFRYDCSKLDQWEVVFEHADSLGLQLHVVTQETENNGAMGGLSSERKLYYRELVARFGHHLAVQWSIGEENSNSDHDRKAFAAYIRALDPYDHPISIHSVYDQASSYYNGLLGDPNYEATSIQGSGNRYNEWAKELRQRSANHGRKWMIYGDEQAPEVAPDLSNLDKLRRIYWEQLLGGGAGCEWYFGYQDTFGDVQSEDFRIVETLWQQSTIAREFWQKYIPFYEMTPNDNLGQSGVKVFHKDAELFVTYVPNGTNTQINISGSEGILGVFWFDPLIGGALQTGSVETVEGNGWVDIGTPPEGPGQDWVVMVGSGNRAPRFVMEPAVLNLNMNFSDTLLSTALSDPVPPNEHDQVVVYRILPDSIPFATIEFDTATGTLSVAAIADSVGEQIFTITADDGQDFNNTFQQTFTLRVSPPLPPEASFTTSLNGGYAPLSVTFDARASSDLNGPIVSYEWNFDGVAEAVGDTAQYLYENVGTFEVRLIVTDEDGMKDTAYQQIVVEELPNEMLFVTNQMNLNDGDMLVKNRLESLGYTVIVKDQQSAVAEDAAEKALVLISSSVSSSAVNTKFKDVSTPVMTWEAYIYDDMGMTPAGNGSGFGSEYGNNNISIQDDTHFLAGGLAGNQQLLSAGSGLNWGNPTNEALTIGIVPGENAKSLLFAYEEGANMANGIASARRVGIFIRDNTATGLTETAWQLFDAAVCWSIGCAASIPVNQPPILAPIADQLHEQGETVSITATANDPEGDNITYTASGLPMGLTIDAATGEISGTITADVQTYGVTIFATDNGSPNEQTSVAFSWEVIEPIPNQPPVLTEVANQTNEQGEEISLQMLAVDPEEDIITFEAIGLPAGLSINPNSGLISGTITALENTYVVSITAIDNGDPNESASIIFDWTVLLPPPNQAPILTSIPNQSNEQQAAISLQTTATDPDGNNLTYTAANLPNGLSINAQTGLISGIITAVAGNYQVEITVTDDGNPNLADTKSFNWEVTIPVVPLTTIWLEAECADFGADWTMSNDPAAANEEFLTTAPAFINSGNVNANHIITLEIQAEEGGTYSCWIRLKTGNGFNSLWQQTGASWTKLDFPNINTWTWVQVQDVSLISGANTLQFAKREGAYIDKWVVSIENDFSPIDMGEQAQNCVPPPNVAPEISAIGDQTHEMGESISLAVIATDANGDQLTFSATGLPEGLDIDAITGLISGELKALIGTYPVTVSVEDNGVPILSDVDSFVWTIIEPLPNQAPVCSPLANQSRGQGATISLFAEAIDSDGDPLIFNTAGLPDGLTINAQTGEITGVITAEPGSYPVTIVVEDSGTPTEGCTIFFDWEVMEVLTNTEILFVVKGLTLNIGDEAIKDHLENDGYNVTLVAQDQATTASAEGMGAVLISSTVSSGAVNTKFTDVSVPVMTWEAYLFDDLKMTGGTFWQDFGNTNGNTEMNILDETHFLAAGLHGSITLSSTNSGMAWGAPNANAIKLGHISGNNSQYPIFAFEAGAVMEGMEAPARRIGFGIRDETAAEMTANGWTLFDAAICWMTSCNGEARITTPTPSNDLNIHVFPNPFTNYIELQFENTGLHYMDIQLVDILGKTVQEWKGVNASSNMTKKLSINDLPKGVYILSIKNEKQVWQHRVVKR